MGSSGCPSKGASAISAQCQPRTMAEPAAVAPEYSPETGEVQVQTEFGVVHNSRLSAQPYSLLSWSMGA